MRVNGGSDLARMQALQKQALATRNRLDTAANEMTTNLKASRFEATGGNLTRLHRAGALARPQRGLHREYRADRASARGDAGEPRADPDAAGGPLARHAERGGARRLCHGADACHAGAERLRRHGGPPERAGGRAVAVRGRHDGRPGAGWRGRDPGRSRRAGGRLGRRGRGDRGDRRLFRQACRGLLRLGLCRRDRRPDAGGDRRGAAARLRDAGRPGRAGRGAARPGDRRGGGGRRLRRQRDRAA